jgi:DegV family protein with EDD domain
MIRIVIDSTCEAPDALLSHPAVSMVPLYVLFGQEALKDLIQITHEEFWARLPSAVPPPTTSQSTPSDFMEVFQRLTDAGDEVIAITISSKLSGTYESAIQAKAGLPGRPIEIVDTLTTSVGAGLMLERALMMLEAGANFAEIVAALNTIVPLVHFDFSLDTLEYLQRGGRIGKAQAFVGTLLSFKPLLALADGVVVPVGRSRSRNKAIEAMIDHLSQLVSARGPQVRLAVTHAGAAEEAADLARRLSERFESPHVFIGSLGPVLGTHVGPGTLGGAVCGEA